jgi:hypothetical protein
MPRAGAGADGTICDSIPCANSAQPKAASWWRKSCTTSKITTATSLRFGLANYSPFAVTIMNAYTAATIVSKSVQMDGRSNKWNRSYGL